MRGDFRYQSCLFHIEPEHPQPARPSPCFLTLWEREIFQFSHQPTKLNDSQVWGRPEPKFAGFEQNQCVGIRQSYEPPKIYLRMERDSHTDHAAGALDRHATPFIWC